MYTKHGHHIPGTIFDPENRPPISRCGGVYLCSECKTEMTNTPMFPEEKPNPNKGEGWYEFIHPTNNTTHIAYVYESGDVYLPEEPDVSKADFVLASSQSRAFKLTRIEDLAELSE